MANPAIEVQSLHSNSVISEDKSNEELSGAKGKGFSFQEEMIIFAQEGDMDNMQALFQIMDINRLKALRSDDGRTLLHYCCYNGHVEMVRFLLDEGFDPDRHDGLATRCTPLMEACCCSEEDRALECAKALLQYGADARLVDIKQESIFHYAARNSSARFVKALSEACRHLGGMSGAELKYLMLQPNDRGRTAEAVAQTATLRHLFAQYREGGLAPGRTAARPPRRPQKAAAAAKAARKKGGASKRGGGEVVQAGGATEEAGLGGLHAVGVGEEAVGEHGSLPTAILLDAASSTLSPGQPEQEREDDGDDNCDYIGGDQQAAEEERGYD